MSNSHRKQAGSAPNHVLTALFALSLLGACGDGVGGGETRDGGADGAVAVGVPPALESAIARQVGRFGQDLRVDLTGSDEDGDIVAVRLALFDAQGMSVPIPGAETGNAIIPLTHAIEGELYVQLPRLFSEHPTLGQASVALIDAEGAESSVLDISIGAQPVLALDALCDATFVENRCSNGLGCKGSVPKVCREGEAPTITAAVYFVDELGPRVLIEGTDSDDDVTEYTIEFLNAAEEPVAIDADGDGSAEAVSATQSVIPGAESGGVFFFRFSPSEAFAASVARVAVTAHDLGERSSNRVVATQAAAPSRSAGQTCSVQGFDRCATGSVCSPGVVGAANRCTLLSTARSQACTAALVLDPAQAITSVRGSVQSLSLWDVPEGGCSSSDPKARPEALVKLVLTQSASKVTLSTDNDYTNFDTTLYALSSCTAEPVLAWCVDDQSSGPRLQLAVLELTNLAAGTYFIVVDSFPSSVDGRNFQLDVTVE